MINKVTDGRKGKGVTNEKGEFITQGVWEKPFGSNVYEDTEHKKDPAGV